jgi:hypothetical protein
MWLFLGAFLMTFLMVIVAGKETLSLSLSLSKVVLMKDMNKTVKRHFKRSTNYRTNAQTNADKAVSTGASLSREIAPRDQCGAITQKTRAETCQKLKNYIENAFDRGNAHPNALPKRKCNRPLNRKESPLSLSLFLSLCM